MSTKKAAAAPRRLARRAKAASPAAVNRRREWRFDLPMKATVEGRGPRGRTFKESSTLENISSTGAYFCLDSGLSVGSKLNLVIDLPKEATEGRRVQLRVGGITVRLEKPDRKGKKQGVAVRFSKDFQFDTRRPAK